MKMLKIFTLALLSVLFIPTENNAMNIEPGEPTCTTLDAEELLKVTIKVDFGRKSKDCQKFGICSISFEFDINLRDLFRAAGGVGSTNDEGGLQIDFLKDSMDGETEAQFFGSGRFSVEESFTVPEEVTSQLGLESYTISKGDYPVLPLTVEVDGQEKEAYRVVF